jgi:hypothetical protein
MKTKVVFVVGNASTTTDGLVLPTTNTSTCIACPAQSGEAHGRGAWRCMSLTVAPQVDYRQGGASCNKSLNLLQSHNEWRAGLAGV